MYKTILRKLEQIKRFIAACASSKIVLIFNSIVYIYCFSFQNIVFICPILREERIPNYPNVTQ